MMNNVTAKNIATCRPYVRLSLHEHQMLLQVQQMRMIIIGLVTVSMTVSSTKNNRPTNCLNYQSDAKV